MMDIRELRIGNYLNHSELGIVEIISVSRDSIRFLSNGNTYIKLYEEINDVSPIPLTEEILINAGFKVGYPGCRFNGWEVEFAYGKYLGKHLEADKLYLAVNSAEYHISDIPIEYVHQLQNIVFDLTKKEIEFKI